MPILLSSSILKSLPQPISAQVSSSMSNVSASNRKWRCTYPVHLHVLKLEAKVITLYEVASVENLREKDLSKSLWLKEKEEKQKNFITMSTQRFQKFCDNRSYEKQKCIALKDKIFTKIPQMESIIKNQFQLSPKRTRTRLCSKRALNKCRLPVWCRKYSQL